MSHLSSRLVTPFAAIAQGLLAAYVWRFGNRGPVPMHFGLDGTVDRYGDRTEAVLLIAGMMVLSSVIGLIIDASARMPEADDARRRGLAMAKSLGLAMPCLVSALMAGLALSADPTQLMSGHIISTVLFALFAVIGAVMGKVPPNAFVGVRTAWSLSSRLAWDRSNRLAGRLFLWFGLIGMVASLALPQRLAMAFLFAGVLIIAGLSIFESWRVWRSDPDRRAV
jgi:uncharacterized membrane protein